MRHFRIAVLKSAQAALISAAFVSFTSLCPAQSPLPLPGCEAPPELRRVLDDELDSKVLNRMKMPKRLAFQRHLLEDLIARFPREWEPYHALNGFLSQYAPEESPTLLDRWVKMAKDHPDDPLALLLAGEALWGKDTPESIRLTEAARNKAPDFPWAARQLAGLYFSGKRADLNKAKKNLEAFFAMCPASSDGYAWYLLSKDPALNQEVAATAARVLRARLEKETDPDRLKDYQRLWRIEFSSRPPKEHEDLRAQLARDVKRLEKLNAHADSGWLSVIISGYKQSGASKEVLAALEDRLIREFPHSNEAYAIVSQRWYNAHSEPADQKDAGAWNKYRKDYEEALKAWIRDYPDYLYLQWNAWFDAIRDDDSISEKDGISRGRRIGARGQRL